ncbi:reverse transcriptase domain-containing protein [Tanacetum coccineum]
MLKEADATPRVNIQDFCEEHYEDILPVIMDKIRRDKRKEVHARLDFEERIFPTVEAALAGGTLLTEIVLGAETAPVASKSHMITPAPPMRQGPNMDIAAMETTPVMRKRGRKVNPHYLAYQRAAPAMGDTGSRGQKDTSLWRRMTWRCPGYVKRGPGVSRKNFPSGGTGGTLGNAYLVSYVQFYLNRSRIVWFDELPYESIDGYKDLKAAFLAYFMKQKKYVKDPVEIHNIKQRDGETIEEFMERFKVETGHMKGAPECMRIFGFMHGVNNPELTKCLNEHVSKTMEEMMITTTAFIRGEAAAAGKKKGHTSWRTQDQSKRHGSERRTPKEILATEAGKFKPPPPMVTPVEKRSSNKFCDFHNDKGHSTDECMQLKKQIEELVRAGKLSHLIKEIKQGRDQPKVGNKEVPTKDKSMAIYMIQPWHRMTRQKVTQSFEYVSEITFPSLTTSSGTEGPLVIEVEIGRHMIHRMYVD